MIESITQNLKTTNSIPETTELPIGFSMALAQNLSAMQAFTALSEADKQSVIARAESVHSKADMQNLVDSLNVRDHFVG